MEEETGGDFDGIIIEILEAEERGHRISVEVWQSRYPLYAREIEDFFSDQSFLQQFNQSVADSMLPEITGFTLHRVIGRGGSGVVYEAEQKNPQRIVALKAMVGARFHTPIGRIRFRREAHASARLDHPHILPVFEAGESDDIPYFTMKLATGPLSQVLDRYQSNTIAAAEMIANLARATHHAHQRGILHRDLKPSNVLLDEAGIGYLSDFGLFRDLLEENPLTYSSELIGTIPYMSPECLDATKPLTVALDVYGLGGILYACLTGKPPFERKSDAETLLAVKNDLPIAPIQLNPKVTADLNAICLKCLEKDPVKRYPSAEALAEDLDNFLQGRPTNARPPGSLRRTAHWVNRHPVHTTIIALAIYLVSSTVTGVLIHQRQQKKLYDELFEANQKLISQHGLMETKTRELRERTHIDQLNYAQSMLKAGDRDALMRVLEQSLPEEIAEGGPSFAWKYLRSSAEQEFACVKVNEQETYGVEFTPDSKKLIVSGQDGTIHFIDTVNLEQRIYREHQGETNAVACCPDGTKLATTSDDKNVLIWGMTNEKVIHVLTGHEGVVDDLAWKDNQTLYTAGRDGMIWEWRFGKTVAKRLIYQMNKAESKKSISFDFVRNRAVISDRSGNAHGVNLSTKKRVQLPINVNGLIDQVFTDPLTGRMAVIKQNGSLYLGEEASIELTGPGQKIDSLAWHPNQELMITATRDGALSFWDIEGNKLLCRIPGHPGKIWGMTFDSRGKVLATAGADSTIRLWNVEEILNRELPAIHPNLDDMIFAQHEKPLLYTGRKNGIDQIDYIHPGVIKSSPEFSTLPIDPSLNPEWGPRYLRVSSDNQSLICVHPELYLLCFDLPSLKFRWSKRLPDAIEDVRFSSHEQEVWCVDEKGKMRSLDSMTGDVLREYDSNFRTEIRVHPTQSIIAALNAKQELQLFHTKTFQVIRQLPQSEYHSYKYFSFSIDGSMIVAGGSNRIVVWDWEKNQITHDISGHGQGLSQLRFTPDGLEIVALFRDGTIRIWRTQSAQQILQLDAAPGSHGPDMTMSRDGSTLLRMTRLNKEQRLQRFDASRGQRPSGWPS